MPLPLSALGIAHTLLSLPPVVAGLVSFARQGRINPQDGWGRAYLVGLALSVVTAFGLSSTGGPNPGHVLGVLALLAAFGGAWGVPRLAALRRWAPYLQTLGLSFSYFLLWVPGINETLSRLPAAAPLASGPEDPLVQKALLAALLLFLAGAVWQCRALRATRRRGDAP